MNAKNIILEWIDANQQAFIDLALEIWNKPEIGYQEHEAVKLQMEFLKKHGFEVSSKDGLPTAFVAEWKNGSGGPVMGLLGEYDALGGLSQKVCGKLDPVQQGAPGHGCGHNLLGAGCMLSACALKEAMKAANLPGVIRYYGCPAEELLTGKGAMAKLGYFDGTDLSVTWHPGDFSYVTGASMTAVFSVKFKFKGRSSHAAVSPEAGRSALDAVELMNVGANYLREHMIDDDRLHYVITDGGRAPNIVPADAEVWYFARAPHATELVLLWERLQNIAKGAALMTETTFTHELLGGCYNTLPNKTLNKLLDANLRDLVGAIKYDEQDMAFAREIQATLPPTQVSFSLNKPVPVPQEDRLIAGTPLPVFDNGNVIMGSSDVGDVANMMPTSMVWGVTWPVGVAHHSWQATASTGSSLGLKGMIQCAKAMAAALYDLVENPALVAEAKKEFAERPNAKPYTPIDELLR